MKITEHANGAIVDYGDNVRIEQHHGVDADGVQGWSVYKRERVIDGLHPVHESDTTDEFVWVKLGVVDTRDEAHEFATDVVRHG